MLTIRPSYRTFKNQNFWLRSSKGVSKTTLSVCLPQISLMLISDYMDLCMTWQWIKSQMCRLMLGLSSVLDAIHYEMILNCRQTQVRVDRTTLQWCSDFVCVCVCFPLLV